MNVGDYVRTKKGLGKITEYKKHDSWGYIVKVEGAYNCYTHTGNGELSDVIKSSSNIIDLIEVGDYINGELITRVQPEDICGDEVLDNQHIYTGEFAHNTEIYEYEIKSIVTHEQFESMKYKVGD